MLDLQQIGMFLVLFATTTKLVTCWKPLEDLTTTVWSLATMERRDDGFLMLAMTELRKRAQLKPLLPQHVSNTLWSLVTWPDQR